MARLHACLSRCCHATYHLSRTEGRTSERQAHHSACLSPTSRATPAWPLCRLSTCLPLCTPLAAHGLPLVMGSWAAEQILSWDRKNCGTTGTYCSAVITAFLAAMPFAISLFSSNGWEGGCWLHATISAIKHDQNLCCCTLPFSASAMYVERTWLASSACLFAKRRGHLAFCWHCFEAASSLCWHFILRVGTWARWKAEPPAAAARQGRPAAALSCVCLSFFAAYPAGAVFFVLCWTGSRDGAANTTCGGAAPTISVGVAGREGRAFPSCSSTSVCGRRYREGGGCGSGSSIAEELPAFQRHLYPMLQTG